MCPTAEIIPFPLINRPKIKVDEYDDEDEDCIVLAV